MNKDFKYYYKNTDCIVHSYKYNLGLHHIVRYKQYYAEIIKIYPNNTADIYFKRVDGFINVPLCVLRPLNI
ncbi:MAG: hypothetical protein NC087_02010 [Anaeroplasma bactoclasticum]|nr:hypothetical protein [Anaeroplasma bactoclasticum]